MLILSAPAFSSAPHVFDGAHAAADRQRNEHLRRHRFDDRQDQVALVGGRGDVEEGEFVGALIVVAARDLDRIARVAQFEKVDAFDDAAGGHVETGDDAFSESHVLADTVWCRWGAVQAEAGQSTPASTPNAAGIRRRRLRAACPRASARPRNRDRPNRSRGRRSRLRCLRLPPRKATSISARFDRPPLAITGIFTAFASRTVASMLMPWSMPSRPMSV